MKKVGIVIGVIAFLLFIFLGIGYLFFKGGTWFVSSIDGNNASSNYTHIISNYYLLKTEKTICENFDNTYKRITASIDSLNWNTEIITGYSKATYFKINIATQEINYFGSKDSLLKSVGVIPTENLIEIPGLK